METLSEGFFCFHFPVMNISTIEILAFHIMLFTDKGTHAPWGKSLSSAD